MDTHSHTKRVSVFTNKVKFGDGEALLVQSDILRAFIVKNVLSKYYNIKNVIKPLIQLYADDYAYAYAR